MKISFLLFFINWNIIFNTLPEGDEGIIEYSGNYTKNFTINYYQFFHNFDDVPEFLYLKAYNFSTSLSNSNSAIIKTKISETLFYSIDFSKKSAIIIPKNYINSQTNLNLYFQCNYDCMFNFSYIFTDEIEILTNECFWFNTLKNTEYKFKIYDYDEDDSNHIFCIKTTYSNISEIDIKIFPEGSSDYKIFNISKIKSICIYSIITFNYTLTVEFPDDDYVYVYLNSNSQKVIQSGYSPINFRYINNDFLIKYIVIKDDNKYLDSSYDSSSNSESYGESSSSNSESESTEYIKYNSLILTPLDSNAKNNYLLDYYFVEDTTENEYYHNEIFLEKIGDLPINFTENTEGLIAFQFMEINKNRDNILHALLFDQILKDRLIKNEVRFYRQGEFNIDYKKYFYKIEKIEGNIHVYTDICMNNSKCVYNNEILSTYKLNKKINFTEIYDISNTFLYFIDSNDINKTSILNPFLIIIECIDEVCIYNISIEYLKKDESKELVLEKTYVMFDTKDSENKYEINLTNGLFQFYIYEIFGKLKLNINFEDSIFEKFTYLNHQTKIINVTSDVIVTYSFNVELNEDTVYYLSINKLETSLSRIILPYFNNLMYIKDVNIYNISILKDYHEKNVKIIFKELIGNLNITFNVTETLRQTYNNLYIYSLYNYEYENMYFNVNCTNTNFHECLFSVMIEDINNNIISSPFFYNYFILDKNIANLKILFPITNSSSNYYFNYFYYNDEEDFTIYQSFSVNNENLTIDKEFFHNNFTIKKYYAEKYSNSNYYYFYIEIFLNTTYDENVQYIVEMNMRTEKQYPTLLFPNEIFYDHYGNLSKLFFIINVDKNDKGNLYYNTEKGCGSINGTIKTIDFQNENINDDLNFENNLIFDKYSQKLSFTEKSTENCLNSENEFCFLFVSMENDLSYSNNINKSFSIMINLNEKEIYIKPEINIIAYLYKGIDNGHMYKFYYGKNFDGIFYTFSSNEGNIIIEGNNDIKKEYSELSKISKYFKFSEIRGDEFINFKIYSNFSTNNYVYYKLEISSEDSTIPLKCDNIYEENYNLLNFYNNTPYENKITCFSNCEYCKIEDNKEFNNLKCINCPLEDVSILYDNENINQTHCLKYCTINYFEYFNRTCEKVEKYVEYSLEYNDTYRSFNFSSVVYEYDNYTFNNTAKIDLKDCESIIKKKYNLNEEDSLIIYLVTIDMLPHQITNQIEYMVFIPNGTKVDLNICEDKYIIVSSHVNLSRTDVDIEQMYYLASKNFDIFNSADPFYTDICTHFTAKNSSTDVTIEDRRKFYVGVKFCEENCVYVGFDTKTHFVKCSCPPKTKSTIDEKIFKENKIDEKFNITHEKSNFKILKCIKKINIYMLIYNVGVYFGLANVIFEIIYAYKFYNLGFDVLPKLIQNIKLMKQFNKQYNFRISKFNKKIKSKNKGNFNEENASNRKFLNNPPKKSFDYDEEESNEKSFNTKKRKNSYKDNSNNSVDNNNIDEKLKKYYVNKKNKIFKYSNEELNEMNFADSLKNDKRKFSEIYYSFLQYSQLFLFTFFNNSDYNLGLLKKQLFFFTLLNHLVFNIILFNDDDVAYIYKHKTNGLSHLFPKVILSFLICNLITFVLKFLCLTGRIVKKMANLKNEEVFKEKIKIYKIIIIIKTLLFQIICVVFTIFSWYYMTIFFGIYRNSQIIIVILFLISFFITMIYPFILSLIGAGLRILSLSHELKILFYFSKIFNFNI